MSPDQNTVVQEKMYSRLRMLYGEEQAQELCKKLVDLAAEYGKEKAYPTEYWSHKDAFLITYADTILENENQTPPLKTLYKFLDRCVNDKITLLHLLPFFPYSSDDGFAVQDFRQVREDLGSWEDVETLGEKYKLAFDAVINHVSASSVYANKYFQGDPGYEDFFISLHPDTDTSQVLRTRNTPLLHEYNTARGTEYLWTTFSRDQLDLNFRNPDVMLEIMDVLLFFAREGAKMIRLDVIPYLWKKLGTSCAHLPETHEFIKLIRDVFDLAYPEVLLLTETNVPHEENIQYFGQNGDEAQIIYNFTLPPLILWSFYKNEAETLVNWASNISQPGGTTTFLNITATHDGIGMRPTEGVLDKDQRQELVDLAYRHNGQITGKRNADGSQSVYELNINYFDALNDPEGDTPLTLQIQKFMASQAIAMTFKGIPGIYIHSLLGSRNDTAAVEETGIPRRINRAQLDLDQLEEELQNPDNLRTRVYNEYIRLLGIRENEPVLHPDVPQGIFCPERRILAIRRFDEEHDLEFVAVFNVSGEKVQIAASDLVTKPGKYSDLLSDREINDGETVTLSPYEFCWLKRQ